MKMLLPLAFILTLVVAVPFGAYAKKGKGKEEPAVAPANPADPANPVAALSPFIINLDGLLALNRVAKSTQAFAAQAPGQLVVLRQGFVAEREKAAADKRGMFDAAVKTSDLINAALEERSKILGDAGPVPSVASSGKVPEPSTKDNLTPSPKAVGPAKPVGAVTNGNPRPAMVVNRWEKRAGEWHEQIAAAYSQIK